MFAKLDIRKNIYSHRIVDTWNDIPYDVKRASNPKKFKDMYDKILQVPVAASQT